MDFSKSGGIAPNAIAAGPGPGVANTDIAVANAAAEVRAAPWAGVRDAVDGCSARGI